MRITSWPPAKLGWMVALAVIFLAALLTDVAVANWAHQTNPAALAGPLREIFWWFGHASSTLVIIVVLGLWHRWHWRAAVLVGGSALMSGILYTIAKWAVGRTRPFKGVSAFEFHPFDGGFAGLFMAHKNSAFPSGHAGLAFAVATALCLLLPRRWGWPLYLGASLVGLFRILEGAHYPSDVVAGAVLGIISAKLTLSIWESRFFSAALPIKYCRLDGGFHANQ